MTVGGGGGHSHDDLFNMFFGGRHGVVVLLVGRMSIILSKCRWKTCIMERLSSWPLIDKYW